MQAALEITARHCGRELDQYGQCVAAKPESWQRDCHHLKMSIARCTSSHRSSLSSYGPLSPPHLKSQVPIPGNCSPLHVRSCQAFIQMFLSTWTGPSG
uniref:Coiled-coil-helix-coiled-coil-helix domain containing 5 n=1 Tax=Rousettus aegyptiacus TaxID=9407 RepID=A0A7J8FET1_ROUAE|nr:coiled-coil-helix-coiled-coil-helix domain containing 5 [Rousettus aegyptiacus]